MDQNQFGALTPSGASMAGDLPQWLAGQPSFAMAPNVGAHALAHWLGGVEAVRDGAGWRDDRVALLARAGVDEIAIDRLLSGEIEPGDDQARAIARATEGDVLPDDWASAPGPAWADAPRERAA